MKYRAQLMGGRLEIDSPQDRRHTCVLLFADLTRRRRVKRQMAINRQNGMRKNSKRSSR